MDSPRSLPDREQLTLYLVGALFCLSGAAALVYQVAWQRILALHTGVGIVSITVIVTAFMAGLGLGSWLAGELSRRTTARRALRCFALLEVGVGVFAALSCWLYYDLLYVRAPWHPSATWQLAAYHTGLLLLPTTLMGMSLPFLVRASVRSGPRACSTIGFLYGVNTLGAAAGAALCPWVLIPALGLRGAVWVGAALNLGVGCVAFLIRPPPEQEPEPPAPSEPLAPPRAGVGFPMWALLYGLSGYCALSLEIVWFRLLDVGAKSSAFTFGSVLAVFLTGLGLGSVVGGRLALRVQRPLRVFLVGQCALLATTALAVLLLLVWLPPHTPGLNSLVAFWKDSGLAELGHDAGSILRGYVLLPALLFLVPTLLMGLCFAALQRAVQDDVVQSGRKVGILQAVNIAGSAAGSLVTGLVLLGLVGTAGSLRLITGLGCVFAVVGVWSCRADAKLFGPLAGLLLGLTLLLPDQAGLWSRMHPGQLGLIEEDASGLVALAKDGEQLHMILNGDSIGWFPYGGVHTALGVVPAVIHPAPREVALIGLGSAETAWAAGCRQTVARITVFEVQAAQRAALAQIAETGTFPPLRRFLADRRARVVVADARQALAASRVRYDLIETDALHPSNPGSGNLYSVEFFRLCAQRLAPGGLVCAYAPTERARRTFAQVFAHVLWDPHTALVVGSDDPIPGSFDVWRARLEAPRVRAYLSSRTLESVRSKLRRLEPVRPAPGTVNTDLFPRDEFARH